MSSDAGGEGLIRYQAARLVALAASVARASHDLRGVLAPTLLAAERLEASSDAATRRAAEIVVRAVDRATELIRETLETVREGAVPVREQVRLAGLVAAAAAAAGCAVEQALAEDEVKCDPGQLGPALAALFADAARRGAGTVRLERDPGVPRALLVRDDGGAVDAADPFRTEPPDYRRATARELIRAEGGELTLDTAGTGEVVQRIALPGLSRVRAATT